MNIYKTSKLLVAAVLFFSGYVNFAVAEQSESLLNFKFNHLSNIQSGEQASQLFLATNNRTVKFAQYDATWTYPWETKNMNIDLGVTLRHLSGFKTSATSSGNGHFQEVLPLLHASALFALPLKGLYAGIEGSSHFDLDDSQVLDYRAKVSYEWRDGFGLQGGWQHQQFNLDNGTDTGAEFQRTGPFLDFYLNF